MADTEALNQEALALHEKIMENWKCGARSRWKMDMICP